MFDLKGTRTSDFSKSTRRAFLKNTSLGVLSSAMCATFLSPNMAQCAPSPNDRFKIGFIGCGGMGNGDARELAHFGDIVALADVDKTHLEWFKSTPEIVSKPNEVFTTQDYRHVLDRSDIEVVGISTPDHWHVKIAMEALLSGKHVFCQKPLTLTIEENKLIREAVKRTGKVFQVGTQQRLDKDHFMLATLLVRKGLLGKIKRVVVTLNTGPKGGPFPTETPPSSLDWNMFLGQTPYVDYCSQRARGTFRYWYEYSGGQFTDWGAHHVDCALWALDQLGPGKGPTSVEPIHVEHASPIGEDGFPKTSDCYNTAVHFNMKVLLTDQVELSVEDDNFNGIMFEGTEGRIFVNRGKITGKPIEDKLQDSISEEEFVALNKGKPLTWHKDNFFQCIRDGGTPASDVDSHTYSMNLCHLLGIASRLGRKINWDPVNETITGDQEAASFMKRIPRKGFEFPTL